MPYIPSFYNKPIVDGKSASRLLENRISKNVWFENITLPDRKAEAKRTKKQKVRFSTYAEPIKPSFWP